MSVHFACAQLIKCSVKMNIHQIPELLFNSLLECNSNFNVQSYLNDFKKQNTNGDKIDFVYNDLKKCNLLLATVKDEKDDVIANAIRQEGNEIYALGKYEEALTLYTESIKHAKSKSALALIHANRSICLLKLGKRAECLQEIERALANDYPQNRKKLTDRQRYAEKLQESPETYCDQLPKIHEKNPLIQCAENCVKIENNEKYGRHVVATRDIKIGEVIAIEPPFGCILMSEFSTHCHHCMTFCLNLIPCDGCTYALFCGEDCRQQAKISYHKLICPIMKSLFQYELSTNLLSLIVTIQAIDDFVKSDTSVKDQVYRSDRYEEIHDLIRETEKRVVMDLFIKAMVAAMIVNFLDSCTDFLNCSKTRDNFKLILFRQQQICGINSLELTEVLITSCWKTVKLGAGLYSFSSLFNHSCCYNVVRFNYESTMVLRAFTSIKKGQQCFMSYGYQYDYTPKTERQMELKNRYFFDCDCPACKDDWQLWKSPVPTIHKELKMSADKFNSMYTKVRGGDVNVAKCFIPHVIKTLNKCEKFEPLGNAADLKELLYTCYRVLANRRKQ